MKLYCNDPIEIVEFVLYSVVNFIVSVKRFSMCSVVCMPRSVSMIIYVLLLVWVL